MKTHQVFAATGGSAPQAPRHLTRCGRAVLAAGTLVTGFFPWLAGAQYASGPVVNSAGGVPASSATYALADTAGQPAIGPATSTAYTMSHGFWNALNFSPETESAGTITWTGGGSLQWQLNDAIGTAGGDPGWDWLNISGTLTISANSGSKFTTYLATLAGNVAGSAANFNSAYCYAWPIATASGGITGFAAAAFTVNTADFQNTVPAEAAFSVAKYGNSVYVAYAPPADKVFAWPAINQRPTDKAVDVTFTHLAGLAEGVASVTENCSVVATAYNIKDEVLATDLPVYLGTPRISLPPGTTKVKFTATKPNGNPARVALFVYDLSGNAGSTDPAFLNLIVPAGGVVEQRLLGIPHQERYLRVFNGQPGLQSLALTVNGQPVPLGALVEGGSLALDLGAFLAEGEANTLVFTGRGAAGASAFITLAETPGAGQLTATPALAVELTPGGVALSWPDVPSQWQLQTRAALGGAWENVPATPTTQGGRNVVTLSVGAASRFFRLQAGTAASVSAPAQGSSARLSTTNSTSEPKKTYDAITW
jgi:hypothetical protein